MLFQCCIYVCHVLIKTSYLLTYLLNVGEDGWRYDSHTWGGSSNNHHADSDRSDFLSSMRSDGRSRKLHRAQGFFVFRYLHHVWTDHDQQDDHDRSHQVARQLFSCRPDCVFTGQTWFPWITLGELHASSLSGLFFIGFYFFCLNFASWDNKMQ